MSMDKDAVKTLVTQARNVELGDNETLSGAFDKAFKKGELCDLCAALVLHLKNKAPAKAAPRITIRLAVEGALSLETPDGTKRWTEDGICAVVNQVFFPDKERMTKGASIAWYRNDLKNKAVEAGLEKADWMSQLTDAGGDGPIAKIDAILEASPETDVANAVASSGFDTALALLDSLFDKDQETKQAKTQEKQAKREAKAEELKARKAAAKAKKEAKDAEPAPEGEDAEPSEGGDEDDDLLE